MVGLTAPSRAAVVAAAAVLAGSPAASVAKPLKPQAVAQVVLIGASTAGNIEGSVFVVAWTASSSGLRAPADGSVAGFDSSTVVPPVASAEEHRRAVADGVREEVAERFGLGLAAGRDALVFL